MIINTINVINIIKQYELYLYFHLFSLSYLSVIAVNNYINVSLIDKILCIMTHQNVSLPCNKLNTKFGFRNPTFKILL